MMYDFNVNTLTFVSRLLVERPKVLEVFGRQLHLPRTCGGLLDTTFADMCEKVNFKQYKKMQNIMIRRITSSS